MPSIATPAAHQEGGGTCSTSSALLGCGLGLSRASAAATSSTTCAPVRQSATCHTHRSGGMPKQVASTIHRRYSSAWIGGSSGGNWPRSGGGYASRARSG